MMNTTCAIEQESTSKDSAGYVHRTWSTLTASIPARVRNLTASDVMKYGRLANEATNVIYFATDPGLAGNESTRRINFGGVVFYPVFVDNAGGQLNRLWQVLVRKKPLQTSTSG